MSRLVAVALSRSILFLALAFGATGCASTGATFRSGVGDTFLASAPWVAGKPLPADRGTLLVLPVTYQAGVMQPAFADPSHSDGTPLSELVRDVQGALESRELGMPGAAITGKGVTPPDVMFGCQANAVQMECDAPEQGGLLGGRQTRHRLAVGRPSAAWVSALQQRLDEAKATHALVTTVEIGQYLPRQRGLSGKKFVELGRGYEKELPWLTSLETPVSVLQLTAVVVDRNGLAVRIAAEGMLAKRTPLLLSAINAQSLLEDKDVVALRSAVREDLEGSPRVWQVALDNLLTGLQLTSRPGTVAPR